MKKNHVWLCLRFPYLSFESLGLSVNKQQSTIIVDNGLIHCLSKNLIQHGIAVGDDALKTRLMYDIESFDRDLDKEESFIEDIAHILYEFSPHYSTHLHDSVLVELSSSLKLFNGLETLLEKIEAALANAFGDNYLCYQIGIADQSHAAWLSSFSEHSYLTSDQLQSFSEDGNRHSVHQTPLHIVGKVKAFEVIVGKLQNMGFSTIGDLLKQQYFSITKRFGKVFANYIYSLDGRFEHNDKKSYSRETVIPDQLFQESVDFEQPAIKVDQLKKAFQTLLTSLAAFLVKSQQEASMLVWTLHSIKDENHKEIVHIKPFTGNWRFAYELTLLHFEQRNLAFEVDRLELIPDAVCPLIEVAGQSSSMVFSFDDEPDDQPAKNTNAEVFFPDIDLAANNKESGSLVSTKIRAKLGADTIRQVGHQATYVPEQSLFMFIVEGTDTLKKRKPATKNKTKKNTASSYFDDLLGISAQPEPSFVVKLPEKVRRQRKERFPLIFSSEGHRFISRTRPLWLFNPPHVLALSRQRFYYKSPAGNCEIKVLSHAERITYHWSGKLIWRDYYIAGKMLYKTSQKTKCDDVDPDQPLEQAGHDTKPESQQDLMHDMQPDSTLIAIDDPGQGPFPNAIDGPRTGVYAERYWIYRDLNNNQWFVHGLF